MANFHTRHYIFNRLLNAITTEDGGEAGVFTEENLKPLESPGKTEEAEIVDREGDQGRENQPDTSPSLGQVGGKAGLPVPVFLLGT
jgi:hypothetical protein